MTFNYCQSASVLHIWTGTMFLLNKTAMVFISKSISLSVQFPQTL